MTSTPDPNEHRQQMLETWDRAASGWSRRAERIREFGMPVSRWMLEQLALQPGQRVLELAAGPGDTGFLAAELIRQPDDSRAAGSREAGRRAARNPEGTLVCSDASEAMVSVARERARQLAVENVEFRQLELEWIDLPAASVDAALCRWGVMLCVDPGAAVREIRRVLRPGGRVSLAVWDDAALNPWATIPTRALIHTGHASPPDPNAPGQFALSAPGRLLELLEGAGFTEVIVEPIDVSLALPSLDELLAGTLDLSPLFAEAFERLSDAQRAEVISEIASLAEPVRKLDGSLHLRGRSLGGAASA